MDKVFSLITAELRTGLKEPNKYMQENSITFQMFLVLLRLIENCLFVKTSCECLKISFMRLTALRSHGGGLKIMYRRIPNEIHNVTFLISNLM